jgi:hypothetical protein
MTSDLELTQDELVEKVARTLGEMTTLELVEKAFDVFNHPCVEAENSVSYDKQKVVPALHIMQYLYQRIYMEWDCAPKNRGVAN